MKIGGINIIDCKLGGIQINEVRHGSDLIWPDNVVQKFINLTPVSYTGDGTVEQFTFQIESNTSWEVTSMDSWISVDTINGSNNATVTVNLSENIGTGNRTGNVRVRNVSEEIEKYFGIFQDATAVEDKWAIKAYWKFEESTGNAMGSYTSTKDLIMSSNIIRPVSGIIGNAYDFTNGFGNVGNNSFFDFSDGVNDFKVSIQAWVCFTSDSDGRIYTQQVTESRWVSRFWYDSANSELFFILRGDNEYDGGYIGRKITNFDIKLNEWQHLVMTYDGSGQSSGISLYQNALKKDNADKSNGVYGDYAARSGTSISVGTFPGKIDELFFIENVAFSSDNVNYFYNSGNGRDLGN